MDVLSALSSLYLVARLSLGEGRRLWRCEGFGSALAVPQGVQCPRPARVAKLDGRRIVDTDQNHCRRFILSPDCPLERDVACGDAKGSAPRLPCRRACSARARRESPNWTAAASSTLIRM
uniref:Uncharacterized protein n=1 Tax=Globodera rostochiensis TaxID=31243 RepID=A0A914GS23_GLORO